MSFNIIIIIIIIPPNFTIRNCKQVVLWCGNNDYSTLRLHYYHISTAQYVLIFRTNIHTPEYYESYLHCTLPRLNYNLISNKKEFGRLHASAGRPADTRLYLHKWCMCSSSSFFFVCFWFVTLPESSEYHFDFGNNHMAAVGAVFVPNLYMRRRFVCSFIYLFVSDAMGDENRRLERRGKTYKLQNLGQWTYFFFFFLEKSWKRY